MKSIYEIFQSEWNSRDDFPLELDIKYYLLHIQSKLLSSDHLHPILYPAHKTISNHFHSIAVKSEKELMKKLHNQPQATTREQLELEVTLQIFNVCLPKILEYFEFIEKNYGLQYLQNEVPNVSLREYPFYTWGEFFGIWLPFDEHPVISKYLKIINEKYPNGYGNQ